MRLSTRIPRKWQSLPRSVKKNVTIHTSIFRVGNLQISMNVLPIPTIVTSMLIVSTLTEVSSATAGLGSSKTAVYAEVFHHNYHPTHCIG